MTQKQQLRHIENQPTNKKFQRASVINDTWQNTFKPLLGPEELVENKHKQCGGFSTPKSFDKNDKIWSFHVTTGEIGSLRR